MDNQEKKTVKDHLEDEMVKWQTQIDEARLQLHLGAMETKEKLQPHIDELEKKLDDAKKQMEEFDDASEKAWKDIKRGLDSSFKAMQRSFDKAKKHFY
jgi:predicted  nucleic acid-binding Zn-ribbon protein